MRRFIHKHPEFGWFQQGSQLSGLSMSCEHGNTSQQMRQGKRVEQQQIDR